MAQSTDRTRIRTSGSEEGVDVKSLRCGSSLLAVLLVSILAWAGAAADTDDDDSESKAAYEHVWSTTIFSDFKIITNRDADDDVGAFFDQYEFTPNKSSVLPTELGIRELLFDRLGPDETPQLQLRFESPTSNLGVSGSQIDQPFFNQHADLLARDKGGALDLDYWRFRTEDLRLFPNTEGRQFDDLTGPSDRFYHDRTGFFADLRLRPSQISSKLGEAGAWLAPELSLRGGFEGRDGSQQLRFLQDQSNLWGALMEPMRQKVAKAGGGLLVAPGGLFTLTFDVDYDHFRQQSSTITNSDLGSPFLPGNDTVGFVPDTDRITGAIRAQSQLGERVVLEGGFQISHLEQVDDFTPTEIAAGLDDNELLFYSANAAADLNVTDSLSVNAFLKYDMRKNEIPRDTPLYNPYDDGVQVDAFLKRWNRIYAGVEGAYALYRSNLVAVGARYEWIDRTLEPGLPTNLIILEPNARVAARTEIWTIYGRTSLRPLKGLGLSGEIGYQGAPETGYILDLDDYVYGELRASYRLPIKRTVLLTAFLKGGSGKNSDFSLTDGIGPDPAGPQIPTKFERTDIAWGLTATTHPLDDVSLYASFFRSCINQSYDLVLSTLPRYWQNIVAIDFADDGLPLPKNKQMSFILGTHLQFSERTDGDLSYSFTRAQLAYGSTGQTSNVALISDNRSIDADIHGIQVAAGYWLRDGLRLEVGYRLQLFDDHEPTPNSTGSVVPAIDPSETQHTITLGITLTSDLLRNS